MQTVDLSKYFPLLGPVPESLYIIGNLPPPNYKRIVIVGSRRPSSYGIACTKSIIDSLTGQPISIISGLALGIDAEAHRTALHSNIHTIAFPGSGLIDEVLYPRSNVRLAKDIIASGGALLSLWDTRPAAPWTFPARNKIMASIADLVLIVESTLNSGTMITARAALEYKIPLGAIPGNIDSVLSTGPNALIQNGAHCIRSSADILDLLGLKSATPIDSAHSKSMPQHPLLKYITEPIHKDLLLKYSQLPAATLNSEITLLELSGIIKIDARGMIRIIC